MVKKVITNPWLLGVLTTIAMSLSGWALSGTIDNMKLLEEVKTMQDVHTKEITNLSDTRDKVIELKVQQKETDRRISNIDKSLEKMNDKLDRLLGRP